MLLLQWLKWSTCLLTSHELVPQQCPPGSACGWQDSNPNSTPRCVILIHKKLYQVRGQSRGQATFPQKAVSFYLNVLKFFYSWFWEEEEKGRVGCFWFPWEKHGVRREIPYFSKDLSYETWESLVWQGCPSSWREGERVWEAFCSIVLPILLWSRDIVYLVEYLFSATQGYPWNPESNSLPFIKLGG